MISIGTIAASGKGGIVLYVYGSGTPAIDQTYIETGSLNGYPRYVSQDGLIHVFYFVEKWYIADVGVTTIGSPADYYFFEKSSGAPSPWLVELWRDGYLGTLPTPTVSLIPPTPVAMNFDGAGSGSPQPIDVPETGTANGKPEYIAEPLSGNSFICRWTDAHAETSGFAWAWTINGRFGYWSNEDVDYPSDVTSWNVHTGEGVSGPAPTVTAVY